MTEFHTNVGDAGDILETAKVKLTKADEKVAKNILRRLKLDVLTEAIHRTCNLCVGHLAYQMVPVRKSSTEWMHQPKDDNPMWPPLTCKAGPLWEMIKEAKR